MFGFVSGIGVTSHKGTPSGRRRCGESVGNGVDEGKDDRVSDTYDELRGGTVRRSGNWSHVTHEVLRSTWVKFRTATDIVYGVHSKG